MVDLMPSECELTKLAIKYDASLAKIKNRIQDLLDALDECDNIEDKLSVCMVLEVYRVFPAGIHPNAPTYQEYQDFLNDLIEYTILGNS